MTCSVCAHADRVVIDEALVGGASVRDAAGRFGLSRMAIQRHRTEHLSASLVKIAAKREALHERSLADRLERNIVRLEQVMTTGDLRGFVAATAEVRKSIELIARLTGELRDHATVQVVNLQAAPEWIETRALILAALAPYPEARAAVAAALVGDGAAAPRMIEGRVVGDGR